MIQGDLLLNASDWQLLGELLVLTFIVLAMIVAIQARRAGSPRPSRGRRKHKRTGEHIFKSVKPEPAVPDRG